MKAGASMNLTLIIGIPVSNARPGEGLYIGLYVDTDSDEVFGGYELRLTFYDSLGYRYEKVFPVSVKLLDPQADGKACIATHAVAAPLLIDGTERFKTAGLV